MRRLALLFYLIAWSIIPAHAGRFFTKDDFALRRKALMEKTPDGISIFLGGETPEAYVKFRQSNTFYYFTGVEIPDCIAIVDGTTKRTTVFVPASIFVSVPADEEIKPGAEGESSTGIESVLPRDQFNSVLMQKLNQPEVKAAYLVLAPEEGPAVSRDQASLVQRLRSADPWDGRLSRAQNFARLLRERYPNVAVKDLTRAVDEMRWVKSDKEIAVLRECGRIGALGIRDTIAATRPGQFEFFLEGIATGRFLSEGANGLAFEPIVASGENTIELHYSVNNRKMEAGDVVLMDYAPELNHYVVDITRSWPVSGQFNDDQLKIYNCLLDAHKTTIAAVKPGVTVKDLEKICRGVFEKHGFGKNMLRAIGHFVGMSVHDPGFYDRPFIPGVVFNVEPLFMDRQKKIHMRLEDTIIVTASGNENVTSGVPIEVDEVCGLIGR